MRKPSLARDEASWKDSPLDEPLAADNVEREVYVEARPELVEGPDAPEHFATWYAFGGAEIDRLAVVQHVAVLRAAGRRPRLPDRA